MKKRIIALLMCMLMTVTAVPVSPLADFIKIEAAAASERVESLEPFSSLASGKLNMTVGAEETFKVMVLPSSAENKSLKWSSSKTSVVSVSDPEVSSGGIASVKLKALSVGSAKITYSTTDGSDISGSFTVVVAPLVSSLKLNQYVKSIVPGSQGEKLVATVSPSNAGNQVLKWFSSDEKVCTVDRNGVLTPVSQGECTISVATTDGSDIVKTCRLVVANKAKGISFSKTPPATLENGKGVALYAAVTTTDGSKHDAVKWTSSDTKVATVDAEGYVTAKYPGKTTIKATTVDGLDKYVSCTITVTQKITKITLSESIHVGVGKMATVKATYSPSYATDTKLIWSTSDKSIATVSSSGVVTGVKEGVAKITCKNSDGSASAVCTVNVVIPATGISISAASHQMWKGDGVQLYASVTPDEATDKSVTWSSTDKNVATVNAEGYVTAVAGGSCTIKATNTSGQTASCKITVFENATGIEIDEIVKVMYVGQVDKITANVLPVTATVRNVTWETSDKSVVTVESDGTLKALKEGSCTVTATSVDGGYTATCKITVEPKVHVESVSLDKSSLTLEVGKTFQFLGLVYPSNASEKRIKWSSDDATVASISSTGIVTGVKAGSVVITATSYDGNHTAKCKVTVVQPVTGVKLSDSSAKISVGKSKTVTCTVSPSSASNKTVIWSSSNEKVATVSKGVITAKKAGSAVITVKTVDGGFTAACNVTVIVPVTGVSVSVSSVKVPKGETRVVSAAVKPSDATNKAVKWSSSNEKVAKISSSGKITGVAKGSATITCKTSDGSFKASCTVTVVQLVEKVKLDATYLNLQAGKYKTLTAKVTPSSASDTKVKWKSSDKKVAEVSSKGVVKAIGAGTATITAYSADGNAKATCKVTVTQPATGIKLNKKKTTVALGKKITLKATVLPSNASNKKVTWISGNTDRATVSSNGVVKGLSQGYVTITAKTADGKYSASCKVLVAKAVTGIKLDKTSITMNVGKSTTITPTVSPKDATVKTVTWSSDNNDVATVDKNGKVTAKDAGSATITAKSADGTCKATASVLVIKPVKGVSLNKKSAYLDVGEKLTLKPVFKPSDASVRSVTWKSSDKSVATVSSNGVVKGKKLGTVTITCTTKNGKKVAKCKINVVKRVTGISLSHSSEILYFGDTLKLKTTVYPTDATVKTVTYKSSNSRVAKVSSKGVVTPLSVGSAKITVVSKDGSFKKVCKVTVKKAPEKIRVSADSATLKVGEAKTIKYTVTPADATNKKATFKSSNTSVVTVSSKGVITGVSRGKATITLTTENGLKAKVSVTVKQQVTSVEVDPTATVYTGKTLTLYASALPKSAENRSLKWSSSDTSVVKVTSKGVITGMRAGTATVTVQSAENSKLKATCKVTVKQRVTSLTFNDKEVFVTKGAQAELKYTLKPADATNKKVTFKSSDSATVSVTSDGRITGIKSGTAKITITADDNKSMTAVCHITVGEPASGVSLDYKEKTVFVGDTLTLVPTVSPTDAYNKLVRWSSDSANASVDSTGLITALKSGKAVITATTVDGGFSASCELTLLQRATSVVTEKSAVKVLRGETYQLNATVLPEDCYDKSYEWTSENPEIASVTAEGFVNAIAPGTVKLICKSLESGVYTVVDFTVHEPVTDFAVEEEEITLYTPFTKQLTTSFLPLNASDKSVTWTSSDESVVTVSQDGVVTAVGKGEATVTATSNDAGITDTCKFTIFTGVEDIITDKDAYSLHETTSLKIDYKLNPEVVDDPRITFTSSDESIFTVTQEGVITGLVPGEATLTIASVQNPDAKKVIPISVTIAVTGLEISDTEKLIYAGEDYTVTPTIYPADASDKTVIWTSSDESVATVDADGKITAVSRGFAEITATTRDGGFTEKCSIEVVQLPEEVKAEADSATAYMGSTLALNVTVLPEDTNDKTLTWHSSDETVATVDSNGVVTPVKTGSCYITASSIVDGVEKRIELTVVQLAQSIALKSRVVDIFPGQKLRILTQVLPETTTDKSVEWTSSDDKIATVDSNGIVTAHKPGRVQLTVRCLDGSGVKKVVTVNVVTEITGISLSHTAKTLELADSFKLTATVAPVMAYDKSVTYKSSDSKIASVDAEGNVTALKTGKAVITATTADGRFTAKATVTVIKSAEDIRILRTEFSLNKGSKVKVDYEVLPADTTQTDITWSSSDSKIAAVDKNGIITGVAKGTATVTLTVTGTSIKKTVTVTVK